MPDVLDERSRRAADGVRRLADVADTEVAEALATVRHRSIAEPSEEEASPARRRWPLVAAVAALVAIGGAGLLLVDRGSGSITTPATDRPDTSVAVSTIDTAPQVESAPTIASLDPATPSTRVDSTVALPAIERLAIGDSVVLGAAEELVERGFVVDAAESRSFEQGLDILADLVEQGRPVGVLVLHLGTNGSIDERQIERFETLIGEVAGQSFVVTSAAPREWTTPNNDRLQDVAVTRGDVELIPWDAIAPRCLGRCLYPDQMHLDVDGARLYADVLDAITSSPDAATARLDDVRRARVRALSGFDGYSASSTRRTLRSDGSVTEVASSVTMVSSGSVWVDTGDGTWGSHDSETDTTRSAFRDPDGRLRYQEIGAQGDASLSLGILVGHDPTSLAEDIVGDEVSVVERAVDGRDGWDVTWVDTIEQMPTDSRVVHINVQRRRIDAATGLIVSEEHLSTDPSSVAESSSIDEIIVGTELPDAFPGRIPDDAIVDRSGPPPAFRSPATPADVSAAFGGPAPAPAWVDEAEIAIGWSPFVWQQSDEVDLLVVTYVRRRGFVETRVEVTTTRAAPDGPTGPPDGQTIVDGWFCRDPVDDGRCEPIGGELRLAVDGGAFDGEFAVVREGLGAIGGTVSIFDLQIVGPDLDSPEQELARFRWIDG